MGWLVLTLVLGVLFILIVILKPRDHGGGYDPYFDRLNKALKENHVGTGRIVIDQDRLDHNLDIIKAHIPSPDHYRIVVKSIPCVGLIRYIRDQINTNKFMVVHRPFLKVILENFESGIDILLGKPLPVFALEEFYEEIAPELKDRAQKEIQWLVDTKSRTLEYLNFAKLNHLHLRLSIEIDIGLHRGGVAVPGDLDEIFEIIQENSGTLTFSGYMGYDGHVPHAPAIIHTARTSALIEFKDNLSVYKTFIEYGKSKYPELFSGELTFNSGGSGTYSLFGDYPFITDIGIGGAVLRPKSYPSLFLFDLQPAQFIATPLLKKIKGDLIPFIERIVGIFEWWDPNCQYSFIIYGGGWAGQLVAPKGLQLQGLTNDPPNQNLVPNESTINGSKNVSLEIGDYVFYHPEQSDAMFQFEDILIIRDGKVVDCWPVFDRRY
jgi:D-serine deaminase-like pyridoxal phosphate-dependent protein